MSEACEQFFLGGVGIRSLLAAESGDDVDESPVVLDATLSTAGLLLLLLLLVDLGCLVLHLTGTSQRTVHLTCIHKKNEFV